MNKIIRKPFAKFMTGRDIINHLGGGLDEFIEEGKEDKLYGIIIEIKAIDRLDNPKLFVEYLLGDEKKSAKAQKHLGGVGEDE